MAAEEVLLVVPVAGMGFTVVGLMGAGWTDVGSAGVGSTGVGLTDIGLAGAGLTGTALFVGVFTSAWFTDAGGCVSAVSGCERCALKSSALPAADPAWFSIWGVAGFWPLPAGVGIVGILVTGTAALGAGIGSGA
jgi:hypothetical protein